MRGPPMSPFRGKADLRRAARKSPLIATITHSTLFRPDWFHLALGSTQDVIELPLRIACLLDHRERADDQKLRVELFCRKRSPRPVLK
jgi:hypothetical protein